MAARDIERHKIATLSSATQVKITSRHWLPAFSLPPPATGNRGRKSFLI
jgi:hypothetical protein